VTRDDSDDELGLDDLPWEFIYDVQEPERNGDAEGERKRRKIAGKKAIGARMGNFECRIGDCVMLKADGSNEAWVAIICEFLEDEEDGEKAANFMWFSTEKEIRNKEKKRSDFYWVRTAEAAAICVC
jgi:origin recognition complex subunit 1